ncbi:MAG TPA: hypothetical protein VJI96_02505 [Candidatus Andersenbacteria bacterium]|nr:hypothetical protein [Candidatus Andersenbacteria bacterium]
MRVKEFFKISAIPILVASLCCLSPVVLVLTGLATASFGASLADTLYGDYKWLFRFVGLIALTISFILYLRRQKNICTIDEAKKRRNEIINMAAIILIAGIVGYIVFLYGVVHYIGAFFELWAY